MRREHLQLVRQTIAAEGNSSVESGGLCSENEPDAGIIFIDENGGGVGVRLRDRRDP